MMTRLCRQLLPQILLLMLLLQSGCQDKGVATLVLSVVLDPSLRGLTAAQIDLRIHAGDSEERRTYRRADSQPISFPTTLSAQVGQGDAMALVHLSASGSDGVVQAEGQTSVSLALGQGTSVVLVLSPPSAPPPDGAFAAPADAATDDAATGI